MGSNKIIRSMPTTEALVTSFILFSSNHIYTWTCVASDALLLSACRDVRNSDLGPHESLLVWKQFPETSPGSTATPSPAAAAAASSSPPAPLSASPPPPTRDVCCGPDGRRLLLLPAVLLVPPPPALKFGLLCVGATVSHVLHVRPVGFA